MDIAVLGPLTVDGNGSLSPRDRVVLSALVVRSGSTVSSEQLADALWGDLPPASWGKVVPGCITRLRKRLGADSIETLAGGYRLAVDDEDVDAQRFERLAAKGHQLLALGEPDRAALAFRESLALWRGPALRDVEEWPPARVEAERLDELRLEIEESVLDASLRVGLQAGVLAEARARVSQAPVRERRWALLALAQYLSGAQADSLQTLRRCREFLSRELGLDPGPELVDLESAIRRHDQTLTAAAALPKPAARCPYPGLLPYGTADADFFFGRADDVDACRRRLAEQQVLVLVGASGCGKSSLLRAGVIAALERHGTTVQLAPPGQSPRQLIEELPGQPGSVLVVDQLEELVAQCFDVGLRTELADALVAEAECRPVVLAVRADRFGDVSTLPGFGRLIERGLMILPPLGEDDLRQAIEGPAREAALLLEPGLVDVLLHDVRDEPGALPMLSHALRETWERREGRTLTVEAYRSSGGIRGAVTRSAEQVYERLDDDERSTLRALMLRLLTPAPDGEPMRSSVARRSLPTDAGHEQLIELLVRARLITAEADVLTLAHESLARAWPRLRGWLDEDQEGHRILRHLTAAAESWSALERPDTELYRGVRLARTLEWQGRAHPDLTGTEDDFLTRSRQLADEEVQRRKREVQRRRRTRRRNAWVAVAAAMLAVVAGLTSVLAAQERDRAAQERDRAAEQRDRAEAEALASTARRAATLSQSVDAIDQALLLGVEAVHRVDSRDSRNVLLSALTRSPALQGVIAATGRLELDNLAAAGDVVAIADDELRLHDATSLEQVPSASAPIQATQVELHPGGRTMVINAFLEFDSVTGDTRVLTGVPPTGGWERWGARYSGDGQRIAVAYEHDTSEKGLLLVWDTANLYEPILRMPQNGLVDFALDRTGRRVYTFTDNPARLTVTAVASGREIRHVQHPTNTNGSGIPVNVEISPDDASLSLTDGQDVALLDATTLAEKGRFRGHLSTVDEAEFSPDGTLLAAGAADGTVLVWAVASGDLRERLVGQARGATDLAFAANGSLFSASTTVDAGSVLAWDLAGDRRFLRRAVGAAAPVPELPLVAPDGRSVAFFDMASPQWNGGTFVLLDVPSGQRRSVTTSYANWGSFSPSGDRLATPGENMIRVWDPRTGDLVAEREVVDDQTSAVAYSTDGARIVVGTDAGEVFAVDAATLAPTGPRVRLGSDPWELIPVPGGKRVVVGLADADYALVDFEAGEVLHHYTPGVGTSSGVAVSPDGTKLALGTPDGDVGLLDLRSSAWVSQPRRGHHDSVVRVDWTPDGRTFATSGSDGRVFLWSGETGERLTSLRPGQPGSAASLEFLPDGHTLQIATALGEVYRWDTRLSHWIDFACRAAGRNLTEEEWTDAFDEERYRKTCPD